MTDYKYAKIVESTCEDPRNDIEAGTRTIHFGKNADPDYSVLTDDGPKKITHELVELVEAPRRMSKAQLRQYIQTEVLPLEEQGAEA